MEVPDSTRKGLLHRSPRSLRHSGPTVPHGGPPLTKGKVFGPQLFPGDPPDDVVGRCDWVHSGRRIQGSVYTV